MLPCTCIQQANPCHSHTLDFLTSMPCSCWFLLSESPQALFPFSSSLLSKPYLSIWFSVTPLTSFVLPPTHHISKPCLPTKPLIPPVGSLGDISCLVAEIHLRLAHCPKTRSSPDFSVNKFTWEGVKMQAAEP